MYHCILLSDLNLGLLLILLSSFLGFYVLNCRLTDGERELSHISLVVNDKILK